MEIRYITPEEAIDYQRVSAAAFIWNFNAEVDNTVRYPVLAAFDENKLIAGAEIFDFKCNYCHNILNAVVLSGICTLPERRRQGGVRKIFEEVGRLAEENDWVFGFLQPFSIEYYEKFGYARLNRMLTITVPFANLGHIPFCTDVELYDGSQFDELAALHSECAMNENLVTLREEKKHFCDTPLEKAEYTYIHRDSTGKADGYVRFTISRPEFLSVEDLYVLSPDALKSIIGFLRTYDGIVKNLIARKQYQGSPLNCLVDRIDNAGYSDDGSVAARIYNLQKLLESNAYPETHGKFRLKSIDDLERNNGIFEVEYENGKAKITRCEDGDYDIALTAPAAARLMLAGEGHTAQTAVYLNGVEINGNADDFFRAFPYRATRFTDSAWSV